MKLEAEASRISILVARDYMMQTQWIRFIDDASADDFTWSKLLTQYSHRLLKFVINLRANTLPTPDNMRRWNRKGNLHCGLCSLQYATLSHILCGCPWIRHGNKLGFEDRITWRHNGVLVIILNHISDYILNLRNRPVQKPRSSISFVKSGVKPVCRTVPKLVGILDSARDWLLDGDLPELHSIDNPYAIPAHVHQSTTKPDLFIISEHSKIIIFIELTCPDDINMEKWRTKKRERYVSLLHSSTPDWTTHLFTIEVGAKGYVNNRSFFQTFSSLGFPARLSKKVLNDCSREALRCSFVIWINRYNKDFHVPRLSPLNTPPKVMLNTRGPLAHKNQIDQYTFFNTKIIATQPRKTGPNEKVIQ